MRDLLLVNTGSPASPTPRDVRSFIEAMLSDPLVMTVPDWFRPILVKGLIGPFRQYASAKKYKLIWDEEHESSPIMYHSEELRNKLEKQLDFPVEIGMVYLKPSIYEGFQKLNERVSDLEEVVVLPLFPHYAESSYLAAVEAIKKQYEKGSFSFQLRIIEPYFDEHHYIEALSKTIEPYLKEEYERIIFNFHSLPLGHVEKGFEKGKEYDYVYQVKETVRLITDHFNLPDKMVRISFSSAFGRKWLEPSLVQMVENMAKSGVKKVLVLSPGFAMDNLETLYDIDIEARRVFTDHGGEVFSCLPCLNDNDDWVRAIEHIIQ